MAWFWRRFIWTADDGPLYLFVMVAADDDIDKTGAVAFFRDHTVAVVS